MVHILTARCADTPSALTPVVYTISSSFPLYVVGPATERTLSTVLHIAPLLSYLKPTILGRETGNGATLASYILKHYNHAHYRDYFEIYEAPRLPFVPLIGNRSEQYPRLERGDHRLKKRPLLFLVGEQRRDVIPKTLMDERLGEERIEVQEVEVYKTGVMGGFEGSFRERLSQCKAETIVVVVFSPTGCRAMLNVLGDLDEDGKTWRGFRSAYGGGKCVVVTIGPTTRDYLWNEFKFEADVCAEKPSPEGISGGVNTLLRERGML
jgi:uroporphyrinogen-III synthase